MSTHTTATTRPGPPRSILVALAAGTALAAVLLALYAFARRVPDGLDSDRLGAATGLLGMSLAGVTVGTLVLIYQGVRILAGIAVARQLCWSATGLACITAWAYLSDTPGQRTAALTGPGNHHVLPIAQAAWLALTQP